MAPKKFALIFWIESKTTDVLPINKIPQKHRGEIGAVFGLKWASSGMKNPETYEAKLLAVGGK